MKGMNDPKWWEKDPRWDWKIKDAKSLLQKKQWMLEAAELNATALEAKSEWYKKRIVALESTLDNDNPDIEELKNRIAKL